MLHGLKIVFAGTPEFAAQTLDVLLGSGHQVVAVYTQPDRPAGRGRKLTPSPVKTLVLQHQVLQHQVLQHQALQHQLPVRQPVSLRDAAVQRELADWGADLMVVVAYGLILPAAVLGIPRLGCINVHASLLPRWRGAAPIQRAILAGDSETGVTIMQMDAGLDTGPMLLRRPCAIAPDETAQTLHDRLASLGAQALLEVLEQLALGTATPTAQDNGQATYAEKLQKAEAVVDWRQPAEVLARQIRAFNPWPVAYTQLTTGDTAGDPLRLWMAHAIDTAPTALPGTVVEEGRPGIDVATGAGLLRITELQLPGGKRLSAEQFLGGHSLLGQRLA